MGCGWLGWGAGETVAAKRDGVVRVIRGERRLCVILCLSAPTGSREDMPDLAGVTSPSSPSTLSF